MKINDIRQSFIAFFEERDHLKVPSASLLPAQDPSLLFTTAGMVPFKNYFAGIEKPPQPRLTSVQKCLRTTDLEEVGKTKRHMSFFEMLGNFSFGNYFKKESIEFAWEYSTQVLPFDKKDIFISIFRDDDEAYDLWHKHIGIDATKIVRLDEADNFWGPAGETGACGPCSELYLDRGLDYGCGRSDCAPGCECERFLEFWNLVFNQFNKQPSGEFAPLKPTGIDTGAGLERLAALVQGVDSVYDTDELAALRDQVASVYGVEYSGENITPVRVLTDHIRTLTFAMSDGIFPSNESRGYVLRRVLRRALLFGRRLGQQEPMLHKLVNSVVSIYGHHYTELPEAEKLVTEYVQQEETRFLKTLAAGANLLEDVLEKAAKKKIVAGKDAFVLYDTYGFPLEMTQELAELRGLRVDLEEFDEEMQKQRERGRSSFKGKVESLNIDKDFSNEFTGYGNTEDESEIAYLLFDDNRVDLLNEDSFSEESFLMISKASPFYAEGGGQLGDSGSFKTETGQARVIDTQNLQNVIVHVCAGLEGEIRAGQKVQLFVNAERRKELMKHHSATHLLNASLRKVLGDHVKQSGSLVDARYLRFDFTHPSALQENQVSQVEELVNREISGRKNVDTLVLAKDEAEKRGAVMTFGEKYGDVVRVIEMGEFSKEFCGGTHVANTGDIDAFIIKREGSPGAGNRRIEAVAGLAAHDYLADQYHRLQVMVENLAGSQMKDKTGDLVETLASLEKLKQGTLSNGIADWHRLKAALREAETLEIELKKQQKKAAKKDTSFDNEFIDGILKNCQVDNGYNLLVYQDDSLQINQFKALADAVRERDNSIVAIFSSYNNEKWSVLASTTAALANEKKIDMAASLKQSLTETDGLQGGGGGKKEMAQGSGHTSKPENLAMLVENLKKNLLQA